MSVANGPAVARIIVDEQVGQTAGPDAQPLYRFDSTMSRYDDENFDTYYQIQLAVRYTF